MRCSLLLHSSLTPLPGQWDRRQSCKYTLGATFVIISQNVLIARHISFGRATIARHNINMFYGVQLPHVWHFTHGQACMWFYGLEPYMVSHHPAKFGGYRHCVCGDMFLIVQRQDSLAKIRHYCLSLKYMAC